MKQHLNRAVELLGSKTALANALGLHPMAVTQWFNRNRVPAERCRAIEEATGGAVKAADLRPDVFGGPEAA